MASDEDDGTGENPWETFQRHHPQEPLITSPPHPETLEIPSEDPDQAEEEDLDEGDSDDDDDDESHDEHARARIDAEIILASKVGAKVNRKCASSGKTALWTVVPATTQPFELVEPRSSPSFGLVGGLPLLSSGEPDIVALWLKLYPGDMSSHLAAMNASGLRGNAKHKDITEHEYVRFWGLILGARQFSKRGRTFGRTPRSLWVCDRPRTTRSTWQRGGSRQSVASFVTYVPSPLLTHGTVSDPC